MADNIRTVGDLKAALASVPDDMPLAKRGPNGGEWVNGFAEVTPLTLITYGDEKNGKLTLAADNPLKLSGAKKSPPFLALAFD